MKKKLLNSVNTDHELREALCDLREAENGRSHRVEHCHCSESGSCLERNPTVYLSEKNREIDDEASIAEYGVGKPSEEVKAAKIAALEPTTSMSASQESLLPDIELDGPYSRDNLTDEREARVAFFWLVMMKWASGN